VILALFTIPTTAIFHAFWSADATIFSTQLTSFLKNVAMFGGLLMIIGAERAKGGMHMTEYPAVIVQLVSAYDFSSTLNRLSDAFERAHMQIFARIDQRTLAGFSRMETLIADTITGE
jgi:hypothetical protein